MKKIILGCMVLCMCAFFALGVKTFDTAEKNVVYAFDDSEYSEIVYIGSSDLSVNASEEFLVAAQNIKDNGLIRLNRGIQVRNVALSTGETAKKKLTIDINGYILENSTPSDKNDPMIIGCYAEYTVFTDSLYGVGRTSDGVTTYGAISGCNGPLLNCDFNSEAFSSTTVEFKNIEIKGEIGDLTGSYRNIILNGVNTHVILNNVKATSLSNKTLYNGSNLSTLTITGGTEIEGEGDVAPLALGWTTKDEERNPEGKPSVINIEDCSIKNVNRKVLTAIGNAEFNMPQSKIEGKLQVGGTGTVVTISGNAVVDGGTTYAIDTTDQKGDVYIEDNALITSSNSSGTIDCSVLQTSGRTFLYVYGGVIQNTGSGCSVNCAYRWIYIGGGMLPQGIGSSSNYRYLSYGGQVKHSTDTPAQKSESGGIINLRYINISFTGIDTDADISDYKLNFSDATNSNDYGLNGVSLIDGKLYANALVTTTKATLTDSNGTVYVKEFEGVATWSSTISEVDIAIDIVQGKTITYDMNGHGEAISPQTVIASANSVSPAAPSEVGYTFGGWFKDAACTSAFVFGSTVEENITVYAKWTANANTGYSVKHYKQNLENNEYALADTDSLTGTTATDTAAVAKTYTGFTALTFEQSAVSGDGLTVIEIYYDRNVYSVTYKNGDIELQSGTVKYGAATPTYSEATPTKAEDNFKSYTFKDWGAVAETVTEDVTYTATFNEAARKYAINLNVNGGTINEGNITEYTAGTGATLPTDVAKANKGFDGWFDNAACNGTAVTAITATDFGDKTYYAKWLDGFNITYNSDGGSSVVGALVIPPETTVEALPTAPTKAGYTFGGWFTEANGGGTEFTAQTTVNVSITVYAKWTANANTGYSVKHYKQNLENNEYALADTDSLTGTTATDTSAVAKTYTGFTALTFEQSAISGDGLTVIEIYYDRNVYSVTYKNGDIELQSGTVKYGAATPTYSEATPTKAEDNFKSYTFKDWGAVAETVTKDVTYTAVFNETAKTYTVTLNLNGGTISSEMTSYAAGAETKLPVPTKTDNVFKGWFVTETLTGTAVTSLAATDFGSKTFYAKWFASSPTKSGDMHGVSIEAENGFDPNAKLVVGTVEITKEIEKIDLTDATGKKTKIAAVFTIEVTLDNAVKETDGKVKVTIDIPESLNGESGYQIVYIDDSGVAHKYASSVENGKISFTTDHLSYWAIVVDGGQGLSAGAIVGIVLCSVLVLIIAAYVCGYFFLYRKGKLEEKEIAVIYKFLKK